VAGQTPNVGGLPAREILNLIHQLPASSRLQRKLRGPIVDWSVDALLLRQVLFAVQGANWQRSGGKGPKPKPVDLPGQKRRTPAAKQVGADIAQRLRNLGLIPPGTSE
jgi:hypothetical protein